ncbi:hypothetical protein MC885_014139 [Smutsia gigantea]|nr:hypothetical protein MC885_014139 [Smutsia gigantea]
MRAGTRTSCQYPRGHVSTYWKRQTAAGGCADVRGFGARTGLLPALLLRPDWLGALLGVPGLHLGAGGSAGEAERSLDPPPGHNPPPAVPARPLLSVIQSRCCVITRRALGRDPVGQGLP